MLKKILRSYALNFPNLQYYRGIADVYGLDVEYKHSYFIRMYKWLTLLETDYVVITRKRGSQTS